MVTSRVLAEREDELNRKFKLFISNARWINANIDDLKRKFPDTYIAVYKRKVVLTDKDLTDLKEKLKEKSIDLDKVTIEFVKRKPLKLLV